MWTDNVCCLWQKKSSCCFICAARCNTQSSSQMDFYIPAVFIFTDSCRHYSYHEMRNISLLFVRVFLGFKSQLQLVWVHVSLRAIAACHWRPTANFLLSTCCSGSTMLSQFSDNNTLLLFKAGFPEPLKAQASMGYTQRSSHMNCAY